MKLEEMWSKNPTQIWMIRLNKNGEESKMSDAKRHYNTVARAIEHHNHMVDVNPGKEIGHHLYVKTDMIDKKIKLVGKKVIK